MRDVLPFLADAIARRRSVGWARVVSTWGSAPRRPGACMVVVSPVEVAGSVSGGCVEHAAVDEVLGSLASGRTQVVEYGIRDDAAWSAGLSCGGTVRILVEPYPLDYAEDGACGVGCTLVEAVRAGRPVVLVTPLDDSGGPALFDAEGLLVDGEEPPDGVAEAALQVLAGGAPREMDLAGGRWFVHPVPSRERLVIVGGADITEHLVPLARRVGFETIVLDPHGVFSGGRTFGEAPDRLVGGRAEAGLPEVDPRTYVVLLTHDPSVDDPVLHRLVGSDVAYIGALGGRKTQDRRNERLREAGFEDAAIARIDGPVGVPIGAVTPAEIAVSIVARLVETRGRRLRPARP
jgi:xanthine dehydrogenase accessory factor